MTLVKNTSMSRVFIIFLLGSSLVSTGILAAGKTTNTDKAAITKQVEAPDFILPGFSEKIQLSKYRGNIVYVDFWASWCTPCRKSFSWMNAMQDRYGEKGLKIIAINLDESRQDAKSFLKKNPAKFSIAFDRRGRVAKLYEVKVMPSSYLISADGKIAYQHFGFRSADKPLLEAAIEHLVSAL